MSSVINGNNYGLNLCLMVNGSAVFLLEAQLPGTTQDHLQIFNIEMKAKVKSHQMPEQVIIYRVLIRFCSLVLECQSKLFYLECQPKLYYSLLVCAIGCVLEVE